MDPDPDLEVRPITVLPDDVVNKIAAGEVVVRPVNAVKELVENSLDAGATEISVMIKNGGLDLIRIKDNGKGIDARDFARVCERFATSKLETVQDLQRVTTFGFRGEALASVSCMAKVQVTSRTRTAEHAWSCAYQDCKPTSSCLISAGLVGTQIVVEQLFSAYPHRRATFKYPQEEAVRILGLVAKYAINFPKVAFSVVRHDGKGSFRSPGNGDRHAVVRMVHPTSLSGELRELEVRNEALHFSAHVTMASPVPALTSTAVKARQQKQRHFQLFINNRAVSSPKLKSAVESAFAAKDVYSPFFHISMQVLPSRMDVNVHPTKEYVYFLDESEIIQAIQQELTELLDNNRNTSVVELNNTSFPGKSDTQKTWLSSCMDKPISTPQSTQVLSAGTKRKADSGSDYFARKVAPKLMVRVDARNRTLDEFFGATDDRDTVVIPDGNVGVEPVKSNTTITEEDMVGLSQRCETRSQEQKRLREAVLGRVDPDLKHTFENCKLVGFVDATRATFQCKNVVILAEFLPILEEFFFQRAVRVMGDLKRRRLLLNPEQGGIPIVGLVDKFLNDHPDLQPPNQVEDKTRDEAVDELVASLCDRSVLDLLWESFGVSVEVVDEVGPCLQTVLCLVNGYTPLLELQLPKFAFDLVTAIWNKSQVLHRQLCRALSLLHVPTQLPLLTQSQLERHCQVIKCQIFPLLKTDLNPPSQLRPFISELISTVQAFKIFGRC